MITRKETISQKITGDKTMKKLSSKHALIVLVALVLGVCLIAANSAQAEIVYTSVGDTYAATDFTASAVDIFLNPDTITFPAPVYEINPYGGDAEFRIDAINFLVTRPRLFQSPAPVVYGQATGLTNIYPDRVVDPGDPNADPPVPPTTIPYANYAVGYYIPATVDIGSLADLLDPPLPSSEIEVEIPVIQKLAFGTEIGMNSNFLNNTESPIKDLLGVDIGGFSAELQIVETHVNLIVVSIDLTEQYLGLYGEFINSRGYTGFQFEDDEGGIHYGWLDIALAYAAGEIQNLTIYGWAYEEVAGASILAGQTTGGAVVPIPATVLLLGSGLMGLGLLGWRRKKS